MCCNEEMHWCTARVMHSHSVEAMWGLQNQASTVGERMSAFSVAGATFGRGAAHR